MAPRMVERSSDTPIEKNSCPSAWMASRTSNSVLRSSRCFSLKSLSSPSGSRLSSASMITRSFFLRVFLLVMTGSRSRRMPQALRAERSPAGFVDGGQRDVGELVVGGLLLVEDPGQKVVRFHLSELLGPFAQRPIPRDFVVLDGLAAADDGRIFGDGTLGVLDDPVGLLDQPLDGVALVSGCFPAERFEDRIQRLDLAFGFAEVVLQGCFQLAIGGGIDHLRQRFGDGILRVVDILERMLEGVGKGFHGACPALHVVAGGRSGTPAVKLGSEHWGK